MQIVDKKDLKEAKEKVISKPSYVGGKIIVEKEDNILVVKEEMTFNHPEIEGKVIILDKGDKVRLVNENKPEKIKNKES